MSMELGFDRKAHEKERLAFVCRDEAWGKRMPNAEWSRQQAVLIDNFFENVRNMALSSREYLDKMAGRKGTRRDPTIRVLT